MKLFSTLRRALPEGAPQSDILAKVASNPLPIRPQEGLSKEGLAVSAIDFASTSRRPLSSCLRRLEGAELGIAQPNQFSILKWTQPYSEFGGVASGDVHNDGWPDVVVSSQSGAYLYANKRRHLRAAGARYRGTA